jgi:hypothetical protein
VQYCVVTLYCLAKEKMRYDFTKEMLWPTTLQLNYDDGKRGARSVASSMSPYLRSHLAAFANSAAYRVTRLGPAHLTLPCLLHNVLTGFHTSLLRSGQTTLQKESFTQWARKVGCCKGRFVIFLLPAAPQPHYPRVE